MDDASSRRERIESAVRIARQYRLEAAVEQAAAQPAPARPQPGREQAAREEAGRERVNREAAQGLPPAAGKEHAPRPRLDRGQLAEIGVQAAAAAAVLKGVPGADAIHQAVEHTYAGIDGTVRLAGQAAADLRRKVEERIDTREERRHPAQQDGQCRAPQDERRYAAQRNEQYRDRGSR